MKRMRLFSGYTGYLCLLSTTLFATSFCALALSVSLPVAESREFSTERLASKTTGALLSYNPILHQSNHGNYQHENYNINNNMKNNNKNNNNDDFDQEPTNYYPHQPQHFIKPTNNDDQNNKDKNN